MKWSAKNLSSKAVSISASRRTDIPALYCEWFLNRLDAGFCEYFPRNPRQRFRASLRPEDVTHFTFWTKWPRPFFRALDELLDLGYPVLWNVTITGLGGTPVEPSVPAPERAVEAIRELARRLPAAAILWRYDPLFLSERHGLPQNEETFRRLCQDLSGKVDRVATSFVEPFARRTRPKLARYETDTGDRLTSLSLDQQVEALGSLREIARSAGIPFTLCCSPAVRARLECPQSECNGWSWACRAYPELQRHRPLRDKPTRADCGCSEERDIGCYDTCVLGCVYSYGTGDQACARALHGQHDPSARCLVP